MALRVQVDETNCGPLCQHPACWQSNVRQEKGFPKLRTRPPSPDDFELDLPTLKVCNMLDDYGEDSRDLFPSRYSGKPAHARNDLYQGFEKPIRAQSIKVTRAPQTSPKSGSNTEPPVSKFKVVEVQEVFDPEDLRGTWDDTFVPKSYYVWVPNQKKKRRRKMAKSQEESPMTKLKGKGSVKFKDMTEDMVPKEIENNRLTARFEEWPVLKPLNDKHKYGQYSRKKRASARSPIMPQYSMTPRTTQGSSKMEFDHDGLQITLYSSISELLDLPRDILVQVLENTRQSDLMSHDKIKEIIRRFMPPSLERGNTNVSLASQDLLQQKKLNLHEGNKNIRQSHLMETKPVFHLDDDLVDDDDDDEIDEDRQRSTSPYGSLKDLYFGGTGQSRDLNKYKKPLPSIPGPGRAVSAGDVLSTKIPSISLGLPELPSGIRQTKPFTYSKKAELDFTLGSPGDSPGKTPTSSRGPVPTPPTSVRSTETPGSDHGTTIRVNVPSQASARSEYGSEKRRESSTRGSPDHPLHTVSPSYSTRVPIAPATTPATYQQSPTKTTSLLRDMSGSTMANTPQEWPPRDKMNSPLHIIRAPVNTPGSLAQDTSALHTIHETGAMAESEDLVHPVSRGRSVRFEIPEVPPPPSSPQLSDEGQKESSRNAVTVNTIIPQETPSTSSNKPPSGATIRTTATTINTSTLPAENSFIRSNTGPIREVSMISSPEPWPQVQDADFDEAPVPSPETTLHETPRETPQTMTPLGTESKSEGDDQSKTAQEVAVKEEKREPSPEKEKDSEYVNKTEDQSAVVKKMMEDSRKAESPAPPPPSPEAKEDSEIIINKPTNSMTTVLEEEETANVQDNDVSMTVMQISPKGPLIKGGHKSHDRQIDTFQNIDIPAEFDLDYVHPHVQEPTTETIMEEPEPQEEDENKSARTYALSAQSTLANRTISEQAQSEVSSSVVGPAISQASQGPALSEDFSEKHDNSELFGDWSGMVIGSSEGQDTQAMLSSDKPDMTEDGGDHEGFKEDLRQEFEKIKKEIDSSEETSEKS